MPNEKLCDHLTLAFSAIKATKSVIVRGSSNTYFSNVVCAEMTEMRNAAKHTVFEFQSAIQEQIKMLKLMIAAQTFQIGNCYEQALIAFYFLATQKAVLNVELIHMPFADHIFVLIGRAENSDIADPMTWGDDVVVCDPWGCRYYPASNFLFQMNDLLSDQLGYSYFYEKEKRDDFKIWFSAKQLIPIPGIIIADKTDVSDHVKLHEQYDCYEAANQKNLKQTLWQSNWGFSLLKSSTYQLEDEDNFRNRMLALRKRTHDLIEEFEKNAMSKLSHPDDSDNCFKPGL